MKILNLKQLNQKHLQLNEPLSGLSHVKAPTRDSNFYFSQNPKIRFIEDHAIVKQNEKKNTDRINRMISKGNFQFIPYYPRTKWLDISKEEFIFCLSDDNNRLRSILVTTKKEKGFEIGMYFNFKQSKKRDIFETIFQYSASFLCTGKHKVPYHRFYRGTI